MIIELTGDKGKLMHGRTVGTIWHKELVRAGIIALNRGSNHIKLMMRSD